MSAQGTAQTADALGPNADDQARTESASAHTKRGPSTRRALAYVYAGYAFRYLYLLVLIPFYGRVLGAEEYGRLLSAMALMQLVWLLCEYGFPTAGARDTASTIDPTSLGSIYGQHLSGRLWMLAPGLLLGLGGTYASPILRAEPLLGLLATLTGIVAAANLSWYFQGILRFKTAVALEVAGFAINLALILALVNGPSDAWKILAILLGSSLVCTGAAHSLALKTLDTAAVSVRDGWALIKQSHALFLHRSLSMVAASSTTYLLSLFASAAQVGWYGAAERIATVGLSLFQPAGQVLATTISNRITDAAAAPSAYRLMRGSLLAMTALGAALMLATLALAEALVPLILGSGFDQTVPMLWMLALMFPFAAASQVITGYVLIPLRLDRAVWRMSAVTAFVTVILVTLLAHSHGGDGVALARVAGAAVSVALLALFLHQERLLGRIWKA